MKYTIKPSDNFNEHVFPVGTQVQILGIAEDGDVEVIGPDAIGKTITQVVTLDDIAFM